MLTAEECPGMNIGRGRFSDDVEMTVEYITWVSMVCVQDTVIYERLVGHQPFKDATTQHLQDFAALGSISFCLMFQLQLVFTGLISIRSG